MKKPPVFNVADKLWGNHSKCCPRCKLFDRNNTSTLAYVCLEALPWIKEIMERQGKYSAKEKGRAENAIYKYRMAGHGAESTTKKKLKQLMRYK